jgi:hypothetical protein
MQNTTDPMAFVTQLTPETQAIMHEYLQLPFCIGELGYPAKHVE